MKKCINILLAAFALLGMTGCSLTSFDGSRTGNESQFIMTFKRFNTTDSQTLELEQGDSIIVDITNKSGEIDVLIQDENGKIVYRGNQLDTSSFEVGVEEKGGYKISVAGRKAKGSVSFIRSS